VIAVIVEESKQTPYLTNSRLLSCFRTYYFDIVFERVVSSSIPKLKGQ
jgi:hypothetical protein